MEKTIKVTGKGTIKIKPDLIRFYIDLNGIKKEYEETVKESTRQSEKIVALFEEIGFKKTDIKTTGFNVFTSYESYQDKEDNCWKQRLVGYEFNHNMKVEFKNDNKILSKVLTAFSKSDINCNFHFDYTVKSTEKEKNKLLGLAVQDSMNKAKVLAEGAGVELGEILSIDYSWSQVDFVSPTVYRNDGVMMKRSMNTVEEAALDYTPEDITTSDTVTVVYEIR